MNPRLIALGGIGLIILSLTTWGFAERSERLSIKADYDGFIAKAQILAAERLAENQRKEAEYRERLKTADFERNRLMRELRERRERASLFTVPGSPQTSGSNEIVCWSATRFNEGLRELEGIINQGQEIVIDLQTVLSAWPK